LRLEEELPPEKEKQFQEFIQRRRAGEPLAYIIGHKEFFGLDFFVAPGVFIPRPETEILVEKALELAQSFPPDLLLADVGTGCGAIAISLALRLPEAQVYATDVSPEALEAAQRNCRRYGLENRIQFLQGDLLQPLPRPVHLMLANLPYVPEEELPHLQEEIRHFEPPGALAGGVGGLDLIKALLPEARSKLLPGGAIILELAPGQTSKLAELVRESFPQAEVEIVRDLSGLERVALIKA